MSQVQPWSIAGCDGLPILGDAHVPQEPARGVALIAHGFKGYKDYGFIPRLAQSLADAGFVTHRFNFSHSGMTNRVETFERPDLFERDSWNRQVSDLRAILDAIAGNDLPGRGLPLVLIGHSRGGVAALLTAGRHADDPNLAALAGIATIASPATCNPLSDDEASLLMNQGFMNSPSTRTGQQLRVGKAFLQEQVDDPVGHDLPRQARHARCPLLVIHGSDDPTVPWSEAYAIAAAATRSRVLIVPGADHVFNTPNPMPNDRPASAQLGEFLRAVTSFCHEVCNAD